MSTPAVTPAAEADVIRRARHSTLACTLVLPMVLTGRFELAIATFVLLEAALLAQGLRLRLQERPPVQQRTTAAAVPLPIPVESR